MDAEIWSVSAILRTEVKRLTGTVHHPRGQGADEGKKTSRMWL